MSGPVEPPGLPQAELATWRAFRTAGRLVLNRLDNQLRADSGIPHTYYEILVRLSEAPGSALRMNALATVSLSSRSRLSHAVAQLEERGWVRRTSCPADRRGQFAELTVAGATALRAATPGHVAAVRDVVIDALSPAQLAALRDVAETIVARLAPESECG